MNARALIRQALNDAQGHPLDAARLLLRHQDHAEFIEALVREYAPGLRNRAPLFSRLFDELKREHGDTPSASKALGERLDPRENPQLADVVEEEVARSFLAVLLAAIKEEAREMGG